MSTPSASGLDEWNPTSTAIGSKMGRTRHRRAVCSCVQRPRAFGAIGANSKRDSCSGVPVITTKRRPLRIDSTGGSTVPDVGCELVEQGGDTLGSALVTDTTMAIPRAMMPRRRTTGAGRADQLTERQQRGVLSSAGLEGLDGEHTFGSVRPPQRAARR